MRHDADATSNVTSDQPTSAAGSGSTLTFEHRTINIDPGSNSGSYSDPSEALYWADFAASDSRHSKPRKDKATDLALMMVE